MDGTVRPARPEDREAVVAIAERTWTDREMDDYLPDVVDAWLDDPERRTIVVDVDGTAAGICSCYLPTADEAWLSGLRVHPDHRGEGHAARLVEALLDWASERGATVARDVVFSWNDAGLGLSVAMGFEPVTSVRWASPTPAADAAESPDSTVANDPDAAWRYWTHSDARTTQSGLALAPGASWSLAELTRDRVARAADEERAFAVTSDGGTRAAAYRDRVREAWDGEGTVAEYGVAAWDDAAAARALFEAIRADAAAVDADATRVLISETPRHVAQAASVRADLDDEPCFVLAADLTGEGSR